MWSFPCISQAELFNRQHMCFTTVCSLSVRTSSCLGNKVTPALLISNSLSCPLWSRPQSSFTCKCLRSRSKGAPHTISVSLSSIGFLTMLASYRRGSKGFGSSGANGCMDPLSSASSGGSLGVDIIDCSWTLSWRMNGITGCSRSRRVGVWVIMEISFEASIC